MRQVLDTHTHVWNRARHPQGWIDPETMAAIYRDFTLAELEAALGEVGVHEAIVVQASHAISETEDILNGADSAAIVGVVGWVDRESPALADDLSRLQALPNGHKLVGIRHLLHVEPDPEWMLRATVSRGLNILAAANLPFDLVIRPDQLVLASMAVDKNPNVRFVLDHLAKPPIASGDLTRWQHAVRALAERPNVVAKLSGLTIEADWVAWTPGQIAAVLTTGLEAFGASRLMFGSDWPLVRLTGSYAGWLDTYLEWSEQLSPAEQSALDSANARQAYGLK